MGIQLFRNNTGSTLASGVTNVATSVTVQTGAGASFPDPSGGNWYYCTLENSSQQREVVLVTARSGDVFTISRAQDGTAARAWSTGDKFELRVTAGTAQSFTDRFLTLGDSSPVAGAIRDEFDTPVLPSRYAWVQQRSGGYTIANSHLVFTVPAMGAGPEMIMTAALPYGSSSFTLTCSMHCYHPSIASDVNLGFMLRESSTRKTEGVYFGQVNDLRVRLIRWSGDNAESGVAPVDNTNPLYGYDRHMYARIARAGSTLTYQYTTNLASWQTLGSWVQTTHFTGAPDTFGFAMYNASASTAALCVDWVRSN